MTQSGDYAKRGKIQVCGDSLVSMYCAGTGVHNWEVHSITVLAIRRSWWAMCITWFARPLGQLREYPNLGLLDMNYKVCYGYDVGLFYLPNLGLQHTFFSFITQSHRKHSLCFTSILPVTLCFSVFYFFSFYCKEECVQYGNYNDNHHWNIYPKKK